MNKKTIFILLIVVILALGGAFFYYFYYPKLSFLFPRQTKETPEATLNEGLLEKMGHPEKYYFVRGTIKDIDTEDSILDVDTFSSNTFIKMWNGENYDYGQTVNSSFIVTSDTKIFRSTQTNNLFTQTASRNADGIINVLQKNEQQFVFDELQKGDDLILYVLETENRKDNNFLVSRIDILTK